MRLLHNLQFFKQNHTESLISYEVAELEQHMTEQIEKSGRGCVTVSPTEDIDFQFHALKVLLHVIMIHSLPIDYSNAFTLSLMCFEKSVSVGTGWERKKCDFLLPTKDPSYIQRNRFDWQLVLIVARQTAYTNFPDIACVVHGEP